MIRSALHSEVTPRRRTAIKRRRQFGRAVTGYIFLSPWLVGFIGLTLGPMIASLWLSFTDYTLLAPPVWTGLHNYVMMFTQDPRYWSSVKVTAIFVVTSVPVKLVVALLLAMVLNLKIRGLGFYRTAFYVPSLLGGSVAIALMWRQIFGSDGLINHLLALVGVHGPSWISDPRYALSTIILLAIWQVGAPMVIFLAGLRQIPQEFYEAASVDGARALRRFLHVTVPLISPLIFFNLVLQVIGAFQTFAPAFIISDGTGGPLDSTLFYTLYLYYQAFTNFNMGYAAGMAWMLLCIIAGATVINFLGSHYWVFYQDQREDRT